MCKHIPTLLLVLAPLPAAPQTWTRLTPSGPVPSPRNHPAAVMDVANDRMIVVGGNSMGGLLTDTWILSNANGLSGSSWVPVSTSTRPLGRWEFPAMYDSANNRMIIFGQTLTELKDVWVLTNANGLDNTPPSTLRNSLQLACACGLRRINPWSRPASL
jgi:hypothetical protein